MNQDVIDSKMDEWAGKLKKERDKKQEAKVAEKLKGVAKKLGIGLGKAGARAETARDFAEVLDMTLKAMSKKMNIDIDHLQKKGELDESGSVLDKLAKGTYEDLLHYVSGLYLKILKEQEGGKLNQEVSEFKQALNIKSLEDITAEDLSKVFIKNIISSDYVGSLDMPIIEKMRYYLIHVSDQFEHSRVSLSRDIKEFSQQLVNSNVKRKDEKTSDIRDFLDEILKQYRKEEKEARVKKPEFKAWKFTEEEFEMLDNLKVKRIGRQVKRTVKTEVKVDVVKEKKEIPKRIGTYRGMSEFSDEKMRNILGGLQTLGFNKKQAISIALELDKAETMGHDNELMVLMQKQQGKNNAEYSERYKDFYDKRKSEMEDSQWYQFVSQLKKLNRKIHRAQLKHELETRGIEYSSRYDEITQEFNGADIDALVDAVPGVENTKQFIEEITNKPISQKDFHLKIREQTSEDMKEFSYLLDEQYIRAKSIEKLTSIEGRIRYDAFWNMLKKSSRKSLLNKMLNFKLHFSSNIQNWARDRVQSEKVKNLNPKVYRKAATDEANKSRRLLGEDIEQSIEANINARKNNALYVYAERVLGKTKRNIGHLEEAAKKLKQHPKQRNLGKDSYREWVIIQGILQRFGLLDSQQIAPIDEMTIDSWLNNINRQGYNVTLPDFVWNDSVSINYKDLSVEALNELTNAIRQIQQIASFKNQFYSMNRSVSIKDFAYKLSNTIKAKGFKSIIKKEEYERLVKRKGKAGAEAYLASMMRPDFVIDLLQGYDVEGYATSTLWNPIKKGDDGYLKDMQKHAEEMKKIITPEITKRLKKKIDIEIGGKKASITMEEFYSLVLNFFNPEGRDRVINNNKITESAMMSAMKKHLTTKDHEVISNLWKRMGSYWSRTVNQELKMTGYPPEKVDSIRAEVKLKDKNGKDKWVTFEGGYYPLRYEFGGVIQKIEEEVALFDRWLGNPSPNTKRGYTLSRSQNIKKKVRLDLGVINEGVKQITKDLNLRQPIVDVNRVLMNENVRESIKEATNDAVYNNLLGWVRTSSGVRDDMQTKGRDLIAWTRQAATISIMAKKITVSAMQVLGFTVVAKELGSKYTAIGMKNARLGWFSGEKRNFVLDNSPRLRNRWESSSQHKEMMELMGKKGIKATIAQIGFFPIKAMDAMVSFSAWHGAYAKAMDGNVKGLNASHQNAVQYADKIVMQTQGTGDAIYLPQIQDDRGLLSLTTMFYGYWGTLFNQLVKTQRVGRQNWSEGKKQQAMYSSFISFLTLWAIPWTIEEAFRKGFPEDDDEWAETAYRGITYPLGSMVFIRDMAQVQLFHKYKSTPATIVPETIIRLVNPFDSPFIGAFNAIVHGEEFKKTHRRTFLNLSAFFSWGWG